MRIHIVLSLISTSQEIKKHSGKAIQTSKVKKASGGYYIKQS